MKVLSLKLKDEIFQEVEKVVQRLHMPRNAYINQALDFYNQMNKRQILKVQLARESRLVSASSLEVLKEFENFEENFD